MVKPARPVHGEFADFLGILEFAMDRLSRSLSLTIMANVIIKGCATN